jgi:hypothetical protein
MKTFIRAALLASLGSLFAGCGPSSALPAANPATVHRNDSGGAMTGDDSGGAMTGDNPGGGGGTDDAHRRAPHRRAPHRHKG